MYSTSNNEYGRFNKSNSIVQEYSNPYPLPYQNNNKPVYDDRLMPPGLPNIGNTCYINSALQCIFHVPQISNFFISDRFNEFLRKDRKQAKIARIFQNLLKSFREGEIRINDMYDFKETFQELNENFMGYEQQDSQEFLRIFLDNLHEAFNAKAINLKKPPDYKAGMNENELASCWWDFIKSSDNSVITNIFSGQYISSLNCYNCSNVTKCFENFMDISLSFKTNENKYTIDWESKATVSLKKYSF